ncbi:MAG: cobyrinate a,c-diamide synthase [Eubacterium sp.]|nr:cobyrinate a,c-diamide synthase [Eubacterium sp.]
MKNAFMIAATGSGCGKTTITCGILEALKRRGYNSRSFKCGPDYIDPMFHKDILGIPSKNLDLFFTDKDVTRDLFLMNNDSDISVVEGVMGLYDGISPLSDEASSYELASALDIPIILVVDAKGMGRSILAVIRGFIDMDFENRICGVILNRISQGYCDKIKPVIENELRIKVFGCFPSQKEGTLESRYLGLKLPNEIDDLKEKVIELARKLEQTIDIDGILKVSNYDHKKNVVVKTKDISNKVRVAIARDEAFCFYYEDNLRLLRESGADLVEFSPLHDSTHPENIDGIILGGGYPELYAEKLSANVSMLNSIRNALENDIPSLAECGGFMYLHSELKLKDGNSYPMVGLIKGTCEYTGHLVRFGYINIEEKKHIFLSEGNKIIKGHEFHYFDSNNNGSDCISSKPIIGSTNQSVGNSWDSGFVSDNHWWGFAHLYYPSNPEFPDYFVKSCFEYRSTRN